MDTLHIPLTESLRKFIEDRLDEGGYDTAHACIVDLIRADQGRRGEARRTALVQEAIDSGPPIVADAAFWEAKKRRLAERYQSGRPDSHQ